ncbi:hypothetical protein Y032_0051g2123 [Ancylostoma ceylanicum]|uniref:Uncharacterized protein n=1 Tax=Ancylostoma ceylanicum TaxID=53326 RepID=A0A016U8U2_9BILA|nr:hypothetical protein Y032_0051g2123 [Ancylostoma ceylanicum]
MVAYNELELPAATSPGFLIEDVSAILSGPRIVVRGPADPNDIYKSRNAQRWPIPVRSRSNFQSCTASMAVAGPVAQIRGTSWI